MSHKEKLTNISKNYGEVIQNVPGLSEGFMGIKQAVITDDALTAKEKEYVALGIAVAIRCEGCIEAHVANLLKMGVTKKELAEVVGVAVLMGGGPSTVYGSLVMDVYNEFTKD